MARRGAPWFDVIRRSDIRHVPTSGGSSRTTTSSHMTVSRHTTTSALLLVAVAVAGCGEAAGADASPPRSSPPAASSGAPGTGPTSPPPSGSTPSGSPSYVAGAGCATAQLRVTLGASGPSQAPEQVDLPLVFTNVSGTACVMTGYPGVMLRSAAGDGYDLPRSTRVEPGEVTLAPGGAAVAILTALTAAPGDDTAFAPATVVVTPPDEFDQVVLLWTAAPVTDQRGATHPGTFVSALAAAG